MKYLPLLVSSSLLLILASCEYMDPHVTVINQSKHAIGIEHASDTIPYRNSLNTAAYYLSPNSRFRQSAFPSDTVRLTVWGKQGWLDTVKHSRNKKLNLFVFSLDSVRKYQNMDTIKSKHLYQRISLTEHQLKAQNWVIKFSDHY